MTELNRTRLFWHDELIRTESGFESKWLDSHTRTCSAFTYFGHLMQRADSLEKTLMLGKIEGRRRKGCRKMRWLHGITDLMDISLSKFWEMVKDGENGCGSPRGGR